MVKKTLNDLLLSLLTYSDHAAEPMLRIDVFEMFGKLSAFLGLRCSKPNKPAKYIQDGEDVPVPLEWVCFDI